MIPQQRDECTKKPIRVQFPEAGVIFSHAFSIKQRGCLEQFGKVRLQRRVISARVDMITWPHAAYHMFLCFYE